MSGLPTDIVEFQERLTKLLERRQRLLPEVRRCQRRCEPELAYGRHHGTPPSNARLAGVILLMYPDAGRPDDPWTLTLTRRSNNLPDHPGQVSFPGGMLEENETPRQAALREWEEEMGSPSSGFRIVGEMSNTYVFGSNFRVTPIVALSEVAPEFQPNPAEVDRVLTVPAEAVLSTASPIQSQWETHSIRRGQLTFNAAHLPWEGERIWGATLQMLVELACYLRELAANPNRVG